jgi:3-oxoacyl-[acyl-carrier protein] reductase
VSGGGTGLGRAITHALARAGNDVLILGRREEVLERTSREINAELDESRIRWQRADLTVPDEVAAVPGALAARGEQVDVLVNNAGGRLPGGSDGTLEEVAIAWRGNFDGNVLSTVLLTHALLPHLRRPGARVIAMSSNAVFEGREAAYAAAKAALHGWARALAKQLAEDGVTVNLVAPGLCPAPDRQWSGEQSTRAADVARRLVPMGRFGTPEEIASAVSYLTSLEAGYITGQIPQVNGGLVLGRG